jgi:hypothetical protein
MFPCRPGSASAISGAASKRLDLSALIFPAFAAVRPHRYVLRRPACVHAMRVSVPHCWCSTCSELALVPPLLGSSQRLLLRNHTETYYAGMPKCQHSWVPLRRHGDEVQALPGGYYRALGRCDDTMNLGGIKVRRAQLELGWEGLCSR